MIYADTSFLVSLMVSDANSARARDAMSLIRQPLGVSALGRLEFRTAVLQRVALGKLDISFASVIQRAFEKRFENGEFIDLIEGDRKVWEAAHGVAMRNTVALKLRSLDVWHLGYALTAGAIKICTFDYRMGRAAEAEGIIVIP